MIVSIIILPNPFPLKLLSIAKRPIFTEGILFKYRFG